MARTRQTARKSTGGKAPRKHVARDTDALPKSTGKGGKVLGKGKGGKGLGKAEKEFIKGKGGKELKFVDDYEDEEVTSTMSSTSTYAPHQGNENLSEDKRIELLNSFADSAESSNVEIIFSFDTTGSMASVLGEVRKKVSETISRLMKDIPNIRIGIIAHGDYCADVRTYAVSTLDFIDSTGVDKLCNFVNSVTNTGGGDAPECYELALREATKFSWTEGYSKALVIIGDEVPHPPSYTTEDIYWMDELEKLTEMGVKVYGVRALNNEHAKPFYEGLSEQSGTVSIHFNSFHLIVDMFLAICYREASSQKLSEFQQEVQKDGKMTEELSEIFDTLNKPNPKKQEKKKVPYAWYDRDLDKGVPLYGIHPATHKWVPIHELPKTAASKDTSTKKEQCHLNKEEEGYFSKEG